MEKFFLIIDESGAKGYADQTEATGGELGVIAGYFLPDSKVDAVRRHLDKLFAEWLGLNKSHITDLDQTEQEQIRGVTFQFFLSQHIQWVYEAIYVQGLHENHQRLEQRRSQAKALRRSPIKLSGNEKVDLLHSELFLGVFGKGVAFGMDNFGDQFAIKIITDQVDSTIVRHFESQAREFLQVGQKKTTHQTGFDPQTQKVVKGTEPFRR
jgi:hypothetical protein